MKKIGVTRREFLTFLVGNMVTPKTYLENTLLDLAVTAVVGSKPTILLRLKKG